MSIGMKMGMYMPGEDMTELADMLDMPPTEERTEQEQTEHVAEEPQGARRRLPMPMLVVGSVVVSTAATAATIAVRRRMARQRGARRWLAVNRRTSLISPRVFVMLPLSSYVQVFNRNASQRRIRMLRRRLARLGRRQGVLAQQFGQLSALRERVPVGKK